MSTRLLHVDSVLTRTEVGTAKMRARASDITPKLRSVLFLIDGTLTFGRLLERAGSLSDLLESQIHQLLEKELISATDPSGSDIRHNADSATRPVSPGHRALAQDLPPLVAAKMQLLMRLETIKCDDIDLLGSELLDAKTLRELAFTAKSITNQLAMSAGIERSQQFWKESKEILRAWRDLSAKTEGMENE